MHLAICIAATIVLLALGVGVLFAIYYGLARLYEAATNKWYAVERFFEVLGTVLMFTLLGLAGLYLIGNVGFIIYIATIAICKTLGW